MTINPNLTTQMITTEIFKMASNLTGDRLSFVLTILKNDNNAYACYDCLYFPKVFFDRKSAGFGFNASIVIQFIDSSKNPNPSEIGRDIFDQAGESTSPYP